jgi:GNAT superfamily N-acetyltransferase
VLEFKIIREEDEFGDGLTKEVIVDFLKDHLEQFGDTRSAITKAVDYAFSDAEGKGGFILAAYSGDDLVGAVVINDTGMAEYVPEHLLVYIAVNRDYRNRGLGAEIMKKIFDLCEGSVALHVEYENPAKRFYERLGMTNKYAEMRYTK